MRRFKREEDITEDDLQSGSIEESAYTSICTSRQCYVVGGLVGYYWPGYGVVGGAKLGAKYGASLVDILLEMKQYALKAKECAKQTLQELAQ